MAQQAHAIRRFSVKELIRNKFAQATKKIVIVIYGLAI